MTDLAELEQHLARAMRQTGTSSYERGRPSGKSVPVLTQIKGDLLELLESDANSQKGWVMLSSVQETLLDYAGAVRSIERAIQCGDRSKKSRKRLAILRQATSDRHRFPLSREQADALREYLELHNANEESFGHGLEVSRRWLDDNGFPDPDAVLRTLESFGCFDDFTIHRQLAGDDWSR